MENTSENKENLVQQGSVTAQPNIPVDNKKPFIKRWIFAGVIIIAVIIVLIVLFVYFKGSKQSQAQILEQQGLDSFNAGDFGTAEQRFESALNNDPKNGEIQAALIQAFANEGNHSGTEKEAFNKAKPFVDKALKENPNDPNVLLAVGYLYETKGDYQTALTYYKKAQVIDSNNAKVWYHIGHISAFLDKQSDSIAAYQKAYALDPDDPDIELAQARVYLSQNKAENAVTLFKKVGTSSKEPSYIRSDAFTNAAILARTNLSDYKGSLSLAKSALDADPVYSPALAEYATNLMLNGDVVGAITYMKKAIDANPRISKNYWGLGAFYRIQKQYDIATQYQQEALERFTDDNTIVGITARNSAKSLMEYDLATDYSIVGQSDKILPLLEDALKLNPNLKQKLDMDFRQYNSFQAISDSPDFQKLL